MKNFYRGSLWRKWDLHVHTIKSVFNNNFDKKGNEDEDNDSSYLPSPNDLDLNLLK